jgi:cell division protein FtsB
MNVDLGIWNKLSRFVVFLLFVAGILAVVVWYWPLIEHNERLRKHIFELNNQVRSAEENNRNLERSLHALRHDPRTVERLAREKLGYAKPGETVIRFVEGSTNAPFRSP